MTSVPTLDAAEVATTEAVDRLIESVRAELAALTLHVRAAAANGGGAAEAASLRDHTGPYRYLTPHLSARLESAKAHLSKELECARAEAASRVRAAEAEAAAVVAAARAVVLGVEPLIAPAGNGSATSRPTQNGSANGHILRLTAGTALLPSPAPAAASPEPPLPLVPSRTDGVLVPASVAAVRAPSRRASGRRGIRRYLYVDTVLPMVAVLIILVILLAWIG